MGEELTLAEKVELLYSDANNVIKRKPLKLPKRAKVKPRKAKKGWIGIAYVNENNIISGEKVLLRDAAFKTRDELIHATDGSEILWWDGKFPVIIQESKKVNPKKFSFNDGKNGTYGQRYIRAKMLLEQVKKKGGDMSILIWVLVIGVVGFLIYKFAFGGGT